MATYYYNVPRSVMEERGERMGMFFLYKYIARNLLKHLLLTFYAHRHNHMPITD